MDPWQTIAVHAVVAASILLQSFAGPKLPPPTENDLESHIIQERIEAIPEPSEAPTATTRPQKSLGQAPKKPVLPTFSGDVAQTIVKYAQEYQVNPSVMLSIAQCESGLRATAANGPYAGIFQFNTGTWVSNRRAMGLPTDPVLRNHPEEAAKTAAFKMSRDGFGAWPACSKLALR